MLNERVINTDQRKLDVLKANLMFSKQLEAVRVNKYALF